MEQFGRSPQRTSLAPSLAVRKACVRQPSGSGSGERDGKSRHA